MPHTRKRRGSDRHRGAGRPVAGLSPEADSDASLGARGPAACSATRERTAFAPPRRAHWPGDRPEVAAGCRYGQIRAAGPKGQSRPACRVAQRYSDSAKGPSRRAGGHACPRRVSGESSDRRAVPPGGGEQLAGSRPGAVVQARGERARGRSSSVGEQGARRPGGYSWGTASFSSAADRSSQRGRRRAVIAA